MSASVDDVTRACAVAVHSRTLPEKECRSVMVTPGNDNIADWPFKWLESEHARKTG